MLDLDAQQAGYRFGKFVGNIFVGSLLAFGLIFLLYLALG